ncbi:MAG TPA: GxxExxY protein [Candidatus Methylomirabilis sp.]|nr:GxxExxY protein [Candidatus Methylomirabilis sp.]
MQKDPRTFEIIGAAMEVHRELGPGFLEAVYQEAFARELIKQGIPFRSEVELPVFSKGQKLSTSYRADFVCFDSIIVEVKALGQLTGIEESQVINHLKASGHSIGPLLNFGARSLEHKRLVLSPRKSA